MKHHEFVSFIKTNSFLPFLIAMILLPQLARAEKNKTKQCPEIDGASWTIASNPDLGKYTSPKQQPVDFGIWQAADGTWQLWSCIRNTKCGGNTRLFYRWEGQQLTDRNWKPCGIAMEADPKLGETPGGLQAPHVVRVEGRYYMFYGDWKNICLAKSDDGKNFHRVLNRKGRPSLFSGPYGNTRDPMVLRVDDRYYCYYTGHQRKDDKAKYACAVFCCTSTDLHTWGPAKMVSAGGRAASMSDWYGGNAECPFVVPRDGFFYLFRNQKYGKRSLNTQYRSSDPLDFGIDVESYTIGTLPLAAPEIVVDQGRYYIVSLLPSLKGIQIAKLKWISCEP